MLDDALVLRRAARLLAGERNQRPFGGDVALGGFANCFGIKRRRRQVAADVLDRDPVLRQIDGRNRIGFGHDWPPRTRHAERAGTTMSPEKRKRRSSYR